MVQNMFSPTKTKTMIGCLLVTCLGSKCHSQLINIADIKSKVIYRLLSDRAWFFDFPRIVDYFIGEYYLN
jgi:hypothetical protein